MSRRPALKTRATSQMSFVIANCARKKSVNDKNFVYLLCALFYILAIGYGVVTVQHYLVQPEPLRKTRFNKTIFRSGDLILWSSDFKWYTDLEKIACGSRFTHVGIVFVDKAERVFLWESDARPGHALTPLLDILKKFKGSNCTAVLRKLNRPVDSEKFERFIVGNLNNGYSFKLWDAVVNRWLHRMHLPGLLVPETGCKKVENVVNVSEGETGNVRQGDTEDDSLCGLTSIDRTRSASVHTVQRSSQIKKRFCSELVADTYHYLGVINLSLGEKSSAALILPGDFSVEGQSGMCGQLLYWVAPFALGPEIHLTLD